MIEQLLFKHENDDSHHSWFKNALHALKLKETPGWTDSFGDRLTEWNNTHQKDPINVLSLFSGGGGLDIGFHDAGFNIVECNELEKDFAATLLENSKPGKRLFGSKVICKDICDYDPNLTNIDFIIGGPPCQTFSAAGARAAGVNGTDDDRGNLFKEYARLLKKFKPRGFLFENVYRIIGAQGGKPWTQIQEAFKDAGYKLHWRILDAADYGVPQFRERLIIVGLKDGDYQFPYPTHGPDSQDKREFYSAGHAIKGVSPEVEGAAIRGRHGHLLNDIPPGLNYSFYTERMKHPTPYFGWRSKFSDYLYKADPETPVRTIKAQGGQYTGPFHWKNRTFTVEEIKRLQTFPDNYKIIGNRQKAMHQLGNSVPPQIARILALSILQQVFNAPLPFVVNLLPDEYQLGFRTRKSKLTKVYAKKAADALSSNTLRNSHLSPLNSKGEYYGTLTNDYRLIKMEKNNLWDYCFKYSLSNGHLHIKLWDNKQEKDLKFKYDIHSNESSSIKSVLMESYAENTSSITAIWKFLETLIKKYIHKDDLVQFFGHYKSSQNFTINIDYCNTHNFSDPMWKVLSCVSKGYLVSKLSKVAAISSEYKLDEDELITGIKELKDLGFEIRSHNTNKQIKEGFLLIPYSFPTLNERSLQRLTEL